MKRYINLNAGISGVNEVTEVTAEMLAKFAPEDGSNVIAFIDNDPFMGYAPFCLKIQRLLKKDSKVIYGAYVNVKKELGDSEAVKATILAKNEEGIKNIYKIISVSRMNRPCEADWACVSYDEISECRDGILVGFALSGEEFAKSFDSGVSKAFEFADYVEIKPCDYYAEFLGSRDMGGLPSDVAVKKQLWKIVSELLPKLSVAVSGEGTLPKTEEMLEKFTVPDEYKYLFDGNDLAKTLVIDGPNDIADSLSAINPYAGNNCSNKYAKESEEIKSICEKKLFEKYGQNVPQLIRERYEDEIEKITDHGFIPHYYIAEKLTEKCDELGFLHILCGTGASSFVNYLLGICETNPLPPHYYCKKCKRVEFADAAKYQSGFDLNRRDLRDLYGIKTCPLCGEIMSGDGQNIPAEFFAGYYGENVPNFEFRVPKAARETLLDYLVQFFGKDRVFAGDEKSSTLDPHKVCIAPENYEIYNCTPVGYYTYDESTSGRLPVTLIDFRELVFILFEICFFSYDMLDNLKLMEERTGIKAKSIDISEVDIFDFFIKDNVNENWPEELFHCSLAQEIADQVYPADFSDFVRILGLIHGTGTWYDNAENLAAVTVRPDEVIAHREDVMFLLMRYGIDRKTAFNFAEDVRKGKLIRRPNPEMEQMLRDNGIPEFYVDSMKKIQYLFPKSHSTEYALNYLRLIWYKTYRPEAFFKVFIEIDGLGCYIY